jgi:hypothetical protein
MLTRRVALAAVLGAALLSGCASWNDRFAGTEYAQLYYATLDPQGESYRMVPPAKLPYLAPMRTEFLADRAPPGPVVPSWMQPAVWPPYVWPPYGWPPL